MDLVGGTQVDQLANKLVQAWTADTGFALDQLERLNTSDPSGTFLGRLDMQRVGVFGHSLGGATALLFCHDDSRCKAGIDVDGAPLGKVIADGVTGPFMFLLSDHKGESYDAETPEAIRQAGANIRSICDRLPSDRRLEIVIEGANHYMFSDGAILRSPLVVAARCGTLGIMRLDGRRQIAVTAHCIIDFLRRLSERGTCFGAQKPDATFRDRNRPEEVVRRLFVSGRERPWLIILQASVARSREWLMWSVTFDDRTVVARPRPTRGSG